MILHFVTIKLAAIASLSFAPLFIYYSPITVPFYIMFDTVIVKQTLHKRNHMLLRYELIYKNQKQPFGKQHKVRITIFSLIFIDTTSLYNFSI